ncbi:MAG: hypothetical protein Ct9H90mP7_4900 [Candidatus Neomarinimicrobiota bacterium]|nr:MAG: hypothetical protein Ct9H90mP7_4900 [Candidatus Neomarinimicrobiota bacterium]
MITVISPAKKLSEECKLLIPALLSHLIWIVWRAGIPAKKLRPDTPSRSDGYQ